MGILKDQCLLLLHVGVYGVAAQPIFTMDYQASWPAQNFSENYYGNDSGFASPGQAAASPPSAKGARDVEHSAQYGPRPAQRPPPAAPPPPQQHQPQQRVRGAGAPARACRAACEQQPCSAPPPPPPRPPRALVEEAESAEEQRRLVTLVRTTSSVLRLEAVESATEVDPALWPYVEERARRQLLEEPLRRAAHAVSQGGRVSPIRSPRHNIPGIVTKVHRSSLPIPSSEPYLRQDTNALPVKQQWSDPYSEYDLNNYEQDIQVAEAPPNEGSWQEDQWDDTEQTDNMYADAAQSETSCIQLHHSRSPHRQVVPAQVLSPRNCRSPCATGHQPCAAVRSGHPQAGSPRQIKREPAPIVAPEYTEEQLDYYVDVPPEESDSVDMSRKKQVARIQQKLFTEDDYSGTAPEDAGDATHGNKPMLDNFEELEQLIQEEDDDVKMALSLQKRRHLSPRAAVDGNVRRKLKTTSPQKKTLYQDAVEESDDEVSPEVAAAMMHSEEQGILMGAAPSRVYNALFAEDEKDLIAVTSAAPFHPQNVVVPASLGNLPYTSSAQDLVALTASLREHAPPPSNSAFTDSMMQRGLYNSVLAEASKPYVTEPTDAAGTVSENTSKSSIPSANGGTLEYVLDPGSPPDHYSRVQLRGSTSPNWFPGYFEALPSIDGITAVCRDPGTVLEDAWWTLQSTMA